MIYLDNAATTRMAPEAVKAMVPYFSEFYGNPSAVYQLAAKSRTAVDKSRDAIARILGAASGEIYFTSGGSESDNWAIISAFEAYRKKGNHIITTKIEHPAVLRTCEYLERERGARVTYLDVDAEGMIRLSDLEQAITPETILISVMAANNEIGTIEPIREIGQIAHAHGILFHTDAVQAFGHIPIDVGECQIDLLSASGHKFNGPKGIGFLFIGRNVKIPSLIHGGAQERNRRAGTENVPGIVGMGAAAEAAAFGMRERSRQESSLRDYLIRRIREEIPLCRLNGHPEKRLPNNVNVSFSFVQGESILILLDMQGICASSGSACSSGSLDPSHVLLATGLSPELAHGAIRFTLSHENTREEMDQTVACLKKAVERLRSMSPSYQSFLEHKS